MWKRIEDRWEFLRKVSFLTILEFDEYELSISPDCGTGHFDYTSLPQLLEFCQSHPEFHIISMPEHGVYINSCIPGSDLFLLGEGDCDPNLIWDPALIVDESFLQSLNSTFKRRFPKLIRAA